MHSPNEILQFTTQDILQDKEFLKFLVVCGLQKINHTKTLLSKQHKFHTDNETSKLSQEITQLEKEGAKLLSDIYQITAKPETLAKSEVASQEIQNLIFSIRIFLKQTAMCRCLLEWQSPTFANTSIKLSQRGLHAQAVKQAYNDYKRDQHEIGIDYEKQFTREYLPKNPLFPYRTYLTNSGMSALTTIVGFLKAQYGENMRVLIGKSVYFEELIVLKSFFPNAVLFVEDDLESLTSIIKSTNPQAIFVDAVSNNHDPKIFDLKTIAGLAQKHSAGKLHLVIDNTLSPAAIIKPEISLMGQNKVAIVYFESLIKYHQYGLDLAMAGIIYSNAPGTGNFYTYREHLGTNCSDTTASLLPTPNRKILWSRLKRHTRNLNTISELIIASQKANKLSLHLNTPKKSPLNFDKPEFTCSSLGVVSFSEKTKLSQMHKLQRRILSLSKKLKLNLYGGTSFGFQTTRIYIPASRPNQGVPFFRIAVGCETYLDNVKLAKMLCSVLLNF